MTDSSTFERTGGAMCFAWKSVMEKGRMEAVNGMKVKRIVYAVMFMVGLMMMSAPLASAEEVKVDLKPGATMKTLLTDSLGKRVVLRLESNEELEGTVTIVGDNLVHLAKLSKRDFFDAFVSIDRISAVIIRAR